MITDKPATLVLGVIDPEMMAIAQLAVSKRLNVLWAKKDGKPVTYANMYQADWPCVEKGQLWVECSPVSGKDNLNFVDHHYPGDPGYGKPPSDFWEASSLGQVWEAISGDEKPPEDLKLIAATDHCPHAAYSDECPGVEAYDVMVFSAEQIASGTEKSLQDVMRGIYKWQNKFRRAETVTVHGTELHRKSGHAITEKDWLLLREAALQQGVAVMAPIQVGDEVWIRIAGHTTVDFIEAFLNGESTLYEPLHIGPLERVYGDAQRGYAGGLIPSETEEDPDSGLTPGAE